MNHTGELTHITMIPELHHVSNYTSTMIHSSLCITEVKEGIHIDKKFIVQKVKGCAQRGSRVA